MSDLMMNLPDMRGPVGGRYFDEAKQKYVNAEGDSIETADVLPDIDRQIAALAAKKAEIEASIPAREVEIIPSNFMAKKKWLKDRGHEVPKDATGEEVDAAVALATGG